MGSVFALTSAVLFAAAALLVRRGLAGSNAGTATLVSVATNLVAMWALALAVGAIGRIPRAAVLTFLLAGTLAPALARLTYYESIRRIGVARASTISNTTPLFAALLAVPVLGESVSWSLAVGTLCVVVGLALTARPDPVAPAGRPWAGTLLALNTAVLASVSFTLRKLGLRMFPDPAVASALTVTGSLLTLVPYLWLRSRTEPLRADGRSLSYLVAGGIFTTGGFLAYFFALSRSEVVRVTPLANTSPLFALALLALFREGETIRAATVAGAVLTVAGVLLVVVG
ncbi:MAG: DMT family transporter [Armatimonadota bacterium]|nr:DMT family transporter [Armatimonadota bacterium]MDR7450932.1 DMT family transporter [Armatimonadota bacterium]MDR7465854.1 DMT family transporter [Armatimonadota bacterium]MDR7493762.1 DMT family transporter [Armatimonadota bacterium]MDR7498368.1 DMT family transporter [Armatimonadota bacterium]